MSEEQVDRRREILDAAFAEFAAKGFRGATIKSIGRAAGLVSPSLIYWYFPTKEALFHATIEARLPLLQAILEPAAVMEEPPESLLPMLARTHLNSVSQPEVQQMARLFLSEMSKRPEMADMVSRNLMEPVLRFLKAYLERQVELGRLRSHDVRSSARAFIGILLPQYFGSILFPGLGRDGLSNEEHVETAVSIFLDGLRPAKNRTR